MRKHCTWKFQKHIWKTVFVLWLLNFFHLAKASQFGPTFPSHKYPAEKTFHIGLGYNYASTSSNFISTFETLPLSEETKRKLSIQEFSLSPEFQPNRHLSVGGIFTFSKLNYSEDGESIRSKSALGDQRIFLEYRFIDSLGYSMGGALITKFPFYSNPKNVGDPTEIPLGDGQSDYTLLLTSEYWPSNNIRTQVDIGYTYRSSEYSGEIPHQVSLGFVSAKIDASLRIKGNFTLANDSFDGDLSTYQNLVGGSQYLFAQNPWVLVLNPHVELWISSEYALGFNYQYSLVGSNSPYFHRFGLSFIYRYAETKAKAKRQFKEVPIHNKISEDSFSEEVPEKENLPIADDPENL